MKVTAALLFGFVVMSVVASSAAVYTLGTSAIFVGPTAGNSSVLLAVSPETETWTASTNADWLHLAGSFQSGAGSTNVIFSFDANPRETRSGTLSIGPDAHHNAGRFKLYRGSSLEHSRVLWTQAATRSRCG